MLVARSTDKLEETKEEIEAAGGTAYTYSADLSDMDSLDAFVDQVLSDHPAVDMLVNNAGRSIRRSVAMAYDRFHDYERTMQLDCFGAIKLILRLLPHMRERRSGHIVNVSSIGVQTNPPRFSATTWPPRRRSTHSRTRVVGSRSSATAWTHNDPHAARQTPMIARRRCHDSFPTIRLRGLPDLVCEALRPSPSRSTPGSGTFGEVAYALAPKAVDQVLHMAYKVFPDSTAAKGDEGPGGEGLDRGDRARAPDEGRTTR